MAAALPAIPLAEDVERGPVRITRRSGRRLPVPVVDEAFGRSYPLEHRVRRPDQVAADGEEPSAPVGVGDLHHEQAPPVVGKDADVVDRKSVV